MRTITLQPTEIYVLQNGSALSRAAADEILRVAREAIAVRGRFTIALSGGSTPKAIFALLAADHAAGANTIAWDKVQVFFGDERPVPPDHPDSNYRMASEALLSKVPLPLANIHRVHGELDAVTAAARYEAEVHSVFGTRAGEIPRFDLILLGMGADGHTASLFPGTTALTEERAIVTATWVEKLKTHRITFTYPLINHAAEILFITGGADKATMLRNILRGDPTGQTYPSQDVRPVNGRLFWFTDEAAAALL
jgi:6-phosphogluconolactonase